MNHRINPYQPPDLKFPPPMSWSQWLRGSRTTNAGRRFDDATLDEFIEGCPIVFYGVIFFVAPDDTTVLHAAVPVPCGDQHVVRRALIEAKRVLMMLRDEFPDLELTLIRRIFIVRFTTDYTDLTTELAERVEVGAIELLDRRQEME